MTLEEALIFAEKKIAVGEKSDGCTFVPDLGLKKWCIMHDMLRRFKPVPPSRADELFLEGMKTEGYKYYPIAYTYYVAVVVARLIGIYR